MDQYNWLLAEILIEQRAREFDSPPHVAPVPARRAGLRRALATTMLRLGLRLDPVAGERLAATFAFAREGRR